ncbi:MAG: hypothetical protein V2I45_04670 [Halieaceae bacterium]|jgi:hypothetical protein|nr:hypothetical protein [Halieaceae bacterium]
MRDDFEKLMSIHDGEPPEMSDEAPADSPLDAESLEFLERLKAADQAFAAEADKLLDMPVPDNLVATIRDHDRRAADTAREAAPQKTPEQVVSASAAGSAKIVPFPPRRRTVAQLALAAGLAAVVVTNLEWLQAPDAPTFNLQAATDRELFQQSMHRLVSGELEQSADGGLSVMPVASFVTQDKVLCREFLALQGESEFAGVACYSASSGWVIERTQAVEGSQEARAYQMASGDEAAATSLATDIKAAELSAAEEQQAIASGWQSCGTPACK